MHTPHVTTGHETDDAKIRAIVYTGAALAVGAAMVFLLVFGIFRYMADHPLSTALPNPMAEADLPQIPPPPRTEVHPAIELKDLRSQEDQILSTYGWTDQQSGIVRIPIDRAIDLQLQKGFPARKEPPKQ
jgi:hypothetical protein